MPAIEANSSIRQVGRIARTARAVQQLFRFAFASAINSFTLPDLQAGFTTSSAGRSRSG